MHARAGLPDHPASECCDPKNEEVGGRPLERSGKELAPREREGGDPQKINKKNFIDEKQNKENFKKNKEGWEAPHGI